jgi:hypothetical protein
MEITPRPLGEILNEGVVILARVWRRLFAPAFWAFAVLGGLTIATFSVTGAGDFLQVILRDPQALDDLTESELLEQALMLVTAASISVVLQLLATGFVSLAVHKIIASEIGGAPVGPRVAVSKAFGRLLVLAVAGILGLLAVLVGLAALILPGIWLAGCFTMLSPVVALEKVGAIGALRRSCSLVRGRWWPTVGFMVLVGLLGSVASQLVQLIALPALTSAGLSVGAGISSVLLVVVQGMVVAAIAVMATMWYLDLKARNEPLLISNLS